MDYPEIAEGIAPRHRFMSAYEQRIEPPDKSWQYLLFAAEPYETIAFKVCHFFFFCYRSLVSMTRLLPKKILEGPSELNAENLGAQHMN